MDSRNLIIDDIDSVEEIRELTPNISVGQSSSTCSPKKKTKNF